MTHRVFVHGVPDSPEVWTPLKTALGVSLADTHCPVLPGFTAPPQRGFEATKDAYAAWLLGEIESIAGVHGPVDLVGHDWGALLSLRVASLRPDLFRSWAVSGAVIDPNYRGHPAARAWSTPLLGEFVMSQAKPEALRHALEEAGLPEQIAVHDAATWTREKRQCILRLYRSARGLRFSGDWVADLANLPSRGIVIWGAGDPYVDQSFARSFGARHSVPVHVLDGAGHWVIAERATDVASLLEAFWRSE